MKGGRITATYALALAVALLLQFDRVDTWLSSRFEQGMPPWVQTLAQAGDTAYETLGLASMGRKLDCASAPLFDGTYKNTYRCVDSLLAVSESDARAGTTVADEARESAQDAAAGARQAETAEPQVAAIAPGGTPGATPPTGAEAAQKQNAKQPRLNLPCDVLVVGDSLAIALSASLERVFKHYDGLNLIPKGKVASGLQNPQYYDWEQALRQFLKEHKPGLVVVMMGANDAKYLTLDTQAAEPAAVADKRRSVYEARLARFLAVMDERKVSSFWVGLPVMGDQELSDKSRALNAIVSEACKSSANARFLDIWTLLADGQGHYAQHMTDANGRRVKVREGDRIHFSPAGGDIIAKAFLSDVSSIIELKPRDGKEVALAPHTDGGAVR